MHDLILPMQYVRQISSLVTDMGIDADAWLARSQLSQAQLQEDEMPLSLAQFCRLVEDVLSCTAEPAFGLLLGERLIVNTHGLLGYAAMNSTNLRQAAHLIERYIGLRTSLINVRLQEIAGETRLIFSETTPLGGISHTVFEAVILAIKNVLDFMTLGSCPLHRIAFAFPSPSYADLACEVCKCEVEYEQGWNGFVLPTAALDQPLKMADAASFRDAEQILQRELDKLSTEQSMSARVRRVMLEKQHGFPSLNLTARLFHLTPRTLHRRLQAEGTSFKALLEEVRHRLAVEHLKSGHMSVEEIAYSLGYTDLANFRRAFKRWQQQSPSAFRNAQRGGHPPPATG
ncbi:AraC family transcriptional regulator [Pseudomonas sp. HMWF032]|uniref:AraC family transcriptional regulator n=1 Tax=Pseudomonas sp. HMWF032 TaxID=2056866 RepID=UPI000D3B319A|nr:AraC family transcriptional regulator [Pseudomonas sp. HMWF032]PTS86296.1 AraC family transcriptional regulator [Pseudomonas sp. HMWF032]PTT82740.1 AraC family transcriptional regulator [Pseudomonas sp. HMWF010]